MEQYRGLVGVAVILGIGWLLSTDRKRIDLRTVGAGVGMMLVMSFLLLKFGPVVRAFESFAAVMARIISFGDEGTKFLFGHQLADDKGPWGFIFAVKVLPIIVFFASFMAVLYHLGVMQRVVAAVAWVLRRTLRVTGTEALSAAANIFLGQTEAPLTVKPYIAGMTRSQIMAIMVCGFSTIAGSVMAAYIGSLGDAYNTIIGYVPPPDDTTLAHNPGRTLFAQHLMAASVISTVAGLVMAKIMLPETETPAAEDLRSLTAARPATRNVMDAAAEGATEGLKLALNVAAMLVAFVALLAMINYPLTALSELPKVAQWRAAHGIPVLNFENILGYLFMPIAWVMGVAWSDARAFGSLLGKGIIATEFVAYLDLASHMRNGTMSSRSAQIATYALCGFANLPSIAIQIGGLSAMAPERRADFATIGLRAMTAGCLACWMTGAMAGVFI